MMKYERTHRAGSCLEFVKYVNKDLKQANTTETLFELPLTCELMCNTAQ